MPAQRWVAMVCAALLGALTLHLIANECDSPTPGAYEVAVVETVADATAGEGGTQVASADEVQSGDLLGASAAGVCAMLLLAAVTWLIHCVGRPDRRGLLLRRARAPRWPIRPSQLMASSLSRIALSVCRC